MEQRIHRNLRPRLRYARRCCTASQTFPLDDSTGQPTLVFRVNNDEVVLNDTADGGVFLVDTTVTNVTPQWQKQLNPGRSNANSQVFQNQPQTPVVAKPYVQGVRPGRTTRGPRARQRQAVRPGPR